MNRNNFADHNSSLYLSNFYNDFVHHKNSIKNLFETNPNRIKQFSVDSPELDISLDYSKNWIDNNARDLLFKIADQCSLSEKIDSLFNGDKLNFTEQRSALHTALRDLNNNNKPEIHTVHYRINQLCQALETNTLLGFSGKPIDTIINIGIGGSDLGPRMVYHALSNYHKSSIKCFFIANIDPTEINNVLKKISPETSLFIISSKSFTTSETLSNATAARGWLLNFTSLEKIQNHFIAITSNNEKAIQFGINPENILPMWDWVGGRYSLWSAIGLTIALGTSYTVYQELLNGAHLLDNHFRSKSWSENIPVLLALLGIGYINYANLTTHALLPYSQSLKYFASYIQQLDMESNGKTINNNNKFIHYNTGPIIWGESGTNGQHAFHQLLHQGSSIVPCDFIVPLQFNNDSFSNFSNSNIKSVSDYNLSQLEEMHKILVSNAFAQSKTLMDGYDPLDKASGNTLDNSSIYKTLKGNKPSNTLLLPKLTPFYLGVLIAIYEHKVFTQGIIWNINSFDQWGVEQGKIIANDIIKYLGYNDNYNIDSSTNYLIDKFKAYN